MENKSKRQKLENMRGQMEQERTSFVSHWRDLSDFILPRRQRFFTSDANKGDRRNLKIIDSTATLATRTLRSGMMSGITSPARPWFKLTTPDPKMAEMGRVKAWLDIVTQRMSTMFLRSNLYNVLPVVYGDMGVFATSAMLIDEEPNDVMRVYSLPIGSYMIANDETLRVRKFFREFRMTVGQLVGRFGQRDNGGKIIWDNFSQQVKDQWDQGMTETWVDVCHYIGPNEEYNPTNPIAKYKRYTSCYYEKGYMGTVSGNYMHNTGQDHKFLRESGYDYFPVLAPRWEVTGEDIYGTDCPGMTALGDIKQLQVGEKRIAQAVEKMVNPPMTGPTSLRNQKASILPGDITYIDTREGQQGFRPAHEINARIAEMEAKQDQCRDRIRRCFYEDLFLMLAASDRRNITAREIDERHEEKLLALGPVLEQLNQDCLDPLIDIGYIMMENRGMLPPPPDELQGMDLKVEYISIMAQAQKLVGISGVERFSGFVGNLAAVAPGALDKVNMDQLIDVYSDLTSIPHGIVRTDEEVDAIRQQQQEAMRAQQQAELMKQGAGVVKDLSQSSLEGDNALNKIIKNANAGSLVPAE